MQRTIFLFNPHSCYRITARLNKLRLALAFGSAFCSLSFSLRGKNTIIPPSSPDSVLLDSGK